MRAKPKPKPQKTTLHKARGCCRPAPETGRPRSPSSRKVNRPIWGNSLKVSRQMVPAVRRRAMQTWSCFTNRGRVLLFSPVFLSTIQIKACGRYGSRRASHQENVRARVERRLSNTPSSPPPCSSGSYRNLHLLNAGVNVKDRVVTWTDDGFVFDDDDLWTEERREEDEEGEERPVQCRVRLFTGVSNWNARWGQNCYISWNWTCNHSSARLGAATRGTVTHSLLWLQHLPSRVTNRCQAFAWIIDFWSWIFFFLLWGISWSNSGRMGCIFSCFDVLRGK